MVYLKLNRVIGKAEFSSKDPGCRRSLRYFRRMTPRLLSAALYCMIAPCFAANATKVPVELTPVPQAQRTWVATYKTTKFRIELSTPQTPSPQSGTGRFLPELGSQPAALLAALKPALAAKALPAAPPKKPELRFRWVRANDLVLKEHLPEPGWDLLMIAIEGATQQAEFFLEFNAKTGKAKFAMNNPTAGDAVLRALASVL